MSREVSLVLQALACAETRGSSQTIAYLQLSTSYICRLRMQHGSNKATYHVVNRVPRSTMTKLLAHLRIETEPWAKR